MRRKFHTPHSPYQGGEEPPGPVRTAPAERRAQPDSVSENINFPPRTTLSVSRRRRAARSGQDRPRGAKGEARQREREPHISPTHKPLRTKAAKSRPVRSGPLRVSACLSHPPNPSACSNIRSGQESVTAPGQCKHWLHGMPSRLPVQHLKTGSQTNWG